jgi:hypothetical protein
MHEPGNIKFKKAISLFVSEISVFWSSRFFAAKNTNFDSFSY